MILQGQIAAAATLFLCSLAASRASEPASSAKDISRSESGKQSQTISRSGSRAATKGQSQYFTGDVRVSPLFPANESTPLTGAYVSFEPGARSAWHTHPAGQHLIVTAGMGWIQEWGGPVTEIREGDVVWCPPGVKHWHGASPATAMTHIALTGSLKDKNVDWMEKVSDDQYKK